MGKKLSNLLVDGIIFDLKYNAGKKISKKMLKAVSCKSAKIRSSFFSLYKFFFCKKKS